MRRLGADLVAAGQLLTRLPLARWSARHPPDARRTVWAYPIIGGLVGAAGGGAYWSARAVGLPPVLAGLWTVAALVMLTGGLHEDGLADTADGFGGGRTSERKLAIMRDSAVGAFGVLALVLSLALRVAPIVIIAEPGRVFSALVVAGALGRSAMTVPLLLTGPARADGLAVGLAAPKAAPLAIGWAVAAGLAMTLEPVRAGALATGLAALAGLLCGRVAARQVGGYTGDVLGATEIVAECMVLTALCAATSLPDISTLPY